MEKADISAYSAARITGDYAFGAAGSDNANNRAAIEGPLYFERRRDSQQRSGDVNAYGTGFFDELYRSELRGVQYRDGRGTMPWPLPSAEHRTAWNFAFTSEFRKAVRDGKGCGHDRNSIAQWRGGAAASSAGGLATPR